MSPYDILRRPRITEKNEFLRSERNAYAFEVLPSANKAEIKKAIEAVFDVSVIKVTTQNRAGKTRRMGRTIGHEAAWKQAIVTLAEGQTIGEA